MDAYVDACYFGRLDGTVPGRYEAYWTSGGEFTAGFWGDDPVLYEEGWGTCSEVTRSEMKPVGASAVCPVPGIDTDEERNSVQAVVVTCTYSNPQSDESQTSTDILTMKIRMRRTVCDRTIDSDGDDLSDCREYALQTDTHNPDTDGDGLTDGQEVLIYGTDPRKVDTDGGGVADGDEIAAGTNPKDPSDDGPNPNPSPSPTSTNALSFDWTVESRTKDKDSDAVIDKYVAGGAQSATLEQNQPLTVLLDACGSAGGSPVTWTADGVELPAGGACKYEWLTPEGDYQVVAKAVIKGVNRTGSLTVSPEHHVVVGLGDSYGSGEGAPRGKPIATYSYWDHKGCHRSANAAQARAALKLEKSSKKSAVTFVHLACSGATVDEGILGSFKGQDPQIVDAKIRTDGNDIDAVILSIGGNDIGFAFIIEKCIFKRNCPLHEVPHPDGVGGKVSLHDSTQWLLGRLPERYERVASCLSVTATECELGTNLEVAPARVLQTEYPDLTRNDLGLYCRRVAQGISNDELKWADQVVANAEAGWTFRFPRRLQGDVDLFVSQLGLNTRILNNDVAFGWSPVDGINEASARHGECADNHWIVRLEESLAIQGDEKGGFHPNNKGQKAYGALIAEQLKAAL